MKTERVLKLMALLCEVILLVMTWAILPAPAGVGTNTNAINSLSFQESRFRNKFGMTHFFLSELDSASDLMRLY